MFYPAENSYQYDRRDDGRRICNRSQRNEKEFQRGSFTDAGCDGSPGRVGQSQTTPKCDIRVALEVPGACHCDEDRQEGEGSPGNHVIELVCTGARNIDKQPDDDKNTLQKTGSSQYIYERCDTAGHHCDYTIDQAFLDFGSVLRECHHTGQVLIYILGMGADDDQILSACLNDLYNGRHLLNFLSYGFVRSLFQDKTKSGSAVCCGQNVAFADSIFNVGSQFFVITNLFCHDFSSSFCVSAFPRDGQS